MTPPSLSRLEFYFDFSSPFSYLSAVQIEEIGARHGAGIEWNPILLGPVYKHHGRTPLFQRTVEFQHARRDLDRWAAHLGVPLVFPPQFPLLTLSAARGFRFAQEKGMAALYCRRVFEICWAEGRDISDLAVLVSAAEELGLDRAGFLDSLKRPEIKEWLRGRVEEAIRRGVFGVPTFFVGEEMYYGNDRLFMVEEALAKPAAAATTPFNRWFGIRGVSRGAATSEYELLVTPSLLNRRGVAHGGAVTSLLDTAMGGAVVSGIAHQEWCATLDLSVQFRRPVRPGRILGRGRMVHRGRHAAFAEGEILDAAGEVLAVGRGTWYIWPRKPSS